MNVFDNVFYFETDKGNVGVVRADSGLDARDRVESYYDEKATTIKRCSDMENPDYGVATLFGESAVSRTKNGYEYEININPSEVDKQCTDDWGAAFLWLDDTHGVEYNLCYDNEECESAIYQTTMSDGVLDTDTCTCSHYEIDFSDKNWKRNLINEMERVALEFWK